MDSRPEHDGIKFFRPICVEEFLYDGGPVYSYVKFCGRCRRRIGNLGEVREFCPRCGAGIAKYSFSMGTVEWKPKQNLLTGDWTRLPDELPEFFEIKQKQLGAMKNALPDPNTIY